MSQLALDFAALHRKRDPDTSRAAAGRVDTSTLNARVLEALRAVGKRGMTSHELAAALDVPLVSVSPRLRPLADRALIVATDQRRDRSIVWTKV